MKRTQGTPPAEHVHKKTKISPPTSSGDDTGWTKVERRKSKKLRKAETKIDGNPPRFMYSNGDIRQRSHAVSIDDIRGLILHIVADAPSQNWLRIENSHSIRKLVVLLIPGITTAHLSLPPLPTSATSNPNVPIPLTLPPTSTTTDIPFIAETFSHACPTRAPGDQTRMHSVLSTIFHGPVTGEEKKRRQVQRLEFERVFDKDIERYVLSLEQMIENDYPIPSYMADIFQKPPGWIETPEVPKQPLLSLEKPKSKAYAIDCEMCITEDGKELTRVCMIEYYSGIVVYDQLVKPPKPILDYLTKWSGITPEALESVTTTLAQVQSHILNLLAPSSSSTPSSPPPPPPILVGHSLESDLKALRLCHPRCIDTAIIFHHPRGRPLKPGLAWLTKKWCGREIQMKGEGGHDPEEDARACLDLLKKKIENGPGYGEFKTDIESIFERIGRSVGRGGPGTVRSAVVDHGNPAVMHGAKASTVVQCKDDAEVVEGLMQVIPGHDFVFGRFMGLADASGWTTQKETPPVSLSDPPPSLPPTDLTPVLHQLNTYLTTLHDSLESRTALLIFTGHSDPRRMASLNARKSAFDAEFREGKTLEAIGREKWWSTGDGRELEEEVEKAKRGLLFLGVKAAQK